MPDFLSQKALAFCISLCFWKYHLVQNNISHLFIQEILTDTYCVPGAIVLDTEDTSVNQTDKNPCPRELYILVKEMGSKCVNVCMCMSDDFFKSMKNSAGRLE